MHSLFSKDWPVGALVVVVIAVLSVFGNGFLAGLERDLYDFGVKQASQEAGDRVVVVGIDEPSLQALGRWPWPRNLHAELINKLSEAGARTVGLTVLYSEPQLDPGLARIRTLQNSFAGVVATEPTPQLESFQSELAAAAEELDTDSVLAEALGRAGNVVLPLLLYVDPAAGQASMADVDETIVANALVQVDNTLVERTVPANVMEPPIPPLLQPAGLTGHLRTIPDVDGAYRADVLAINYAGLLIPSQALRIAAAALNVPVEDITVDQDGVFAVGDRRIQTDPNLRMNAFFYGSENEEPPFAEFSFFDVYNGRVRPEVFADRVVLVGATAPGLTSALVTPISDGPEPAVRILAHTVASILNGHYLTAPFWGRLVELLCLVLIGLYLALGAPRLRAGPAAGVSAGLILLLLGGEVFLLAGQSTWLQLATPALALFLGHILLTTKRFLVTEAGKEQVEMDSAESNRMLGLAYQQQGQLDLAFEKFRRCPPEGEVLPALYNLGLDYERKRQFNKAGSVYRYISEHSPGFQDVENRMQRMQKMEETVLLGGAAPAGAGTSLLIGGDISKPMLGRYEVEKEIGKGAMGIVYLGRDPTINRVVAIKTMALSQEFEADEVDEVKERFFREAESAGALQHENIVTIYDAGEEHDLAYIAMEFLKGSDLSDFTKEESLMPLNLAMGICFKLAQALDYAHKRNVVHRDIKPANVMYDPDTKVVKLTDFGIARITDSSKTKTGMVLGTPSYMSPEQVSGKKVDGRSDLFSLGVMLYQLATGQLPFRAESMATLMYKITSDEAPNVFDVKPELANERPCLKAILERALQKDIDARYQSGAEFARDLHTCVKQGAKA